MKNYVGRIFGATWWLSWLLNLASLIGYILLRRRLAVPPSDSHELRLHIIRPYRTETDADTHIVSGSERDELQLMTRLFSAAKDYGNADVIIVTNHADPGLDKILQLALPYSDIVKVIEAPLMPEGTISGKVFNLRVGWGAIKGKAKDEDILIISDSDSDVTSQLLGQTVRAYEADGKIGGVGSFLLYEPGATLAATPFAMVYNPAMGFLALDAQVRGFQVMAGNFVSLRVRVFRAFGGFDSFTNIWQYLADDVAISKATIAAGYKLTQVGSIAVYNRYATWPSWWQRWTRQMLAAKLSVPDLYLLSPLPTYGRIVITELVALYGIEMRQPRFMWPFIAGWALNFVYAGLNGAWGDALVSPATAWANLIGWGYILIAPKRWVTIRGLRVSLRQE